MTKKTDIDNVYYNINKVRNFIDRYKEWAEKTDRDNNVKCLNKVLGFYQSVGAITKIPKVASEDEYAKGYNDCLKQIKRLM